jgi:hypothetical protein
MPQPPGYTPTTDFSQQEALNASGRSTVNTAALDAELANIETTLDATLGNLAQIQRDDGALKDTIVRVHTLSADVLGLMGGFKLRGAWQTATAYAVNDVVEESDYQYVCHVAHTSGGSFSGANWTKFGFINAGDAASYAASAEASKDAAALSASNAAASALSASGSASTATSAANSASSAQSTASSAASNAGISANAAAQSANSAAASAALVKATAFIGTLSKSANYPVVADDRGKLVDCTSTLTLSLLAAATATDGFTFGVRNSGTGVVTITPNSPNQIDGASTLALAAGESCVVVCDVAGWKTVGLTRAALNATGTAPMFACRAWVNFNGTTSPGTIRASGNVSSVTKNGTGDYTVNFTTAMPDANYCAALASGEFVVASADATTPRTVSALRLRTANNGAVLTDTAWVNAAFFR